MWPERVRNRVRKGRSGPLFAGFVSLGQACRASSSAKLAPNVLRKPRSIVFIQSVSVGAVMIFETEHMRRLVAAGEHPRRGVVAG
jgi:hypothetical protein